MISVIVCSYNRADSLKDTLEALKNQAFDPKIGLEIVVVDNNSSDHTRKIVQTVAFQQGWPVRYFFEAAQGLSHARNRGIREAKGDILAFTDDDVIPASHWVEDLWKTFQKEEVDLAGGPILPIWCGGNPPAWLLRPELQAHLALLNRGNQKQVTKGADSNFLYGANMAFRRSLFGELGGFQTDLGGMGKTLMRGDDTEMIHRALASGKRGAYEPNAVVYHKIPRDRMNVGYLRKNVFYAGKAYVKYSKKWDKIPAWLIRECVTHLAAAMWFYGRRAVVRAVKAESYFWYQLGMIMELGGLRGPVGQRHHSHV